MLFILIRIRDLSSFEYHYYSDIIILKGRKLNINEKYYNPKFLTKIPNPAQNKHYRRKGLILKFDFLPC